MTIFSLPQGLKKILILAPLHNKINIIDRLEELLIEYDWVILNGGISSSSNNINDLLEKISKMQDLIKKLPITYNIDNIDLINITNIDNQFIEDWIKSNPNIISIKFPQRNILVVNGGIPNHIRTMEELSNNFEVSFVSKLNNKPWHTSYNGRFGYVISNANIEEKLHKFYNYSMQLGNGSGPNKIYGQVIGELSLKETIIF